MNKRRSESFNRCKVSLDHPFATLPSINMFRINQHITKLSKALLTAGLLGGAAVATLGAGSAQANQWNPPNIPAGPPTPPGLNVTSTTFTFTTSSSSGGGIDFISPTVKDKQLTLLGWSGIPSLSNLNFSLQPLDDYQHHVDLDFQPAVTENGFLTYKIDIVEPVGALWNFDGVELVAMRDNNATITKQYATDVNFTNIIDTLNLPNALNVTNPQGPAFGKTLYVRDSWTASTAPNSSIDTLSNNFSQTEVPAPLPILGAGVAFGSIRKLRKFSARLKTFSMG